MVLRVIGVVKELVEIKALGEIKALLVLMESRSLGHRVNQEPLLMVR